MGIKTYEIWMTETEDKYLVGVLTGAICGIFSTRPMAHKHSIDPTERRLAGGARLYLVRTNAWTYRKIANFIMDNYPNMCVFE